MRRTTGVGERVMKRTILLLALCLAASTAAAASGQVYKWTDAQGVVHYSDAPPPTNTQPNVQTVHVTGGDRPHAVDGQPDAPADSPTPAPTTTASNQPAGGGDARSKACAQAKSNLELLQSKFPVSVAGADGKPQALDDKARQAQIADANSQIGLYCK